MRRLTALPIIALLVSLFAAPAAADHNVSAYTTDIGFEHRRICLDMRTPSGFRVLERAVVYELDVYTNLLVFREYGPNACEDPATNPALQEVVIYTERYDTAFCGGAGPLQRRTVGGVTYRQEWRVRLNLNCALSYAQWDHVLTHELGHAVGLAHRTDTCRSVMAMRCPWLTYLHGNDRYVINHLYWGRPR